MICNRLMAGSVKDCACRLPNEGGWLPCPEDARVLLEPIPVDRPPPMLRNGAEIAVIEHRTLTGEMCHDCGGFNMQRAGTCMLCLTCGSTSGGCS